MHNQTTTPFELLLLTGFTIGCVLSAVAAWNSGVYPALIVCALLALLAAWSLVDSLRQGVRRATPFERFEQRVFMRVIVVVIGGGIALALGRAWFVNAALPWSPIVNAALMLLAIAAWLGSALVGVMRLRGKHESLGAYKRRVHYVEPPTAASEPES